jgi:transcriptional regulator with XRE-family HTH domain
MNKYSIKKQPSTVLLEVAERHKKIRKIQNLSQAELAKRSGVSLGSLKRFETTGQINFESLLKLAHFFDRLGEFDNLFIIHNHSKIAKLFDTTA